MEIKNYQELSAFNNPHGIIANKIYDKDHALIMHLSLKPGEALKPHITPVDVAFYVLEGKPTILVGEEKIKVQTDDLVESPKDIVHCIYNESNTLVRVLVMKLPKPVSKTRFIEK